jgi:hypothetical protein
MSDLPTRDKLQKKWKAIAAKELKDDFCNPALSHFGFHLSGVLEEQYLKTKRSPATFNYEILQDARK